MQKSNKKHKKITVTIGIPTFNEEANIATLLKKLLNQTSTYSVIKKIHIIDDQSRDKTVEKIQSIKDPRIKLQIREERLGQTSAQNTIFDNAKTDVVLILEADTYPIETTYVDVMVEPLVRNSRLGYIQGNMTPLPSKTFLGHVLNTHFDIFTKFVIENPSFPLPISSGRGGRVFTKSVYTKLRWPAGVPDDDYAGVWCVAHKFKGYFSIHAHCYYQRPQTFNDYMKERQKVYNVERTIRKHFSDKVVEKYFQVPKETRFIMMIHFLKNYPLKFCFYLGMQIIEKFIVKKGAYTDFWPRTQTTKDLLLKNTRLQLKNKNIRIQYYA